MEVTSSDGSFLTSWKWDIWNRDFRTICLQIYHHLELPKMELETLNSIMPFPSVGDTDMHAVILIPVCLSWRRIEWWNISKVWKVWIRYSLYSSDNYLNSEKKSMKWLPNFWLLDYTRKLLLMNEICVSTLVLKILIHLVLGGDWDSICKLSHQVFLICFRKEELLFKLFNKLWKLWYDYIMQGKSTRFCFIFMIIWISVPASRSTMYPSGLPQMCRNCINRKEGRIRSVNNNRLGVGSSLAHLSSWGML